MDKNKCVGSTICVQLAPEVFALDEHRQSKVVDADGVDADRLLETAEQCPVSAITLVDAKTGAQVFP